MKQFRLTIKVQIVLTTIFVMIAGVILVGSITNGDTVATTGDCPNCIPGTLIRKYDENNHWLQCDTCPYTVDTVAHTWTISKYVSNNDSATHTPYLKCTVCGCEITGSSLKCSEGAWYYKANNIHYKYCSLCGYYMRQGDCYDENGDGVCDAGCGNTEMHVHSYSSSYINNGNGTHTQRYTCSCGDSYDESTVSCTYGAYTNNGSTHTRTCTVCGYVNTEEHTLITISGKAATCTETGLTEGKECSTCGATTVEQEAIPALGHAEVIDEEVEPTCTTTGLTEGKHCSRCNEVLVAQETIPALGHTGATHANGGVCTRCGTQYEAHEQSSTISDYIITETTHTPIYECTYDGCTETYTGTAQPHNNETYTDNGDGTHSSTCAECGGVTTENHNYESGECVDCNADEPDVEITSEKYEILEGYITKVQPETLISEFKAELETNATEINIYSNDNGTEPLGDDEIVATGMKLELKRGTQVRTFTIIVRGDVDGDGTAGMQDISTINRYRLNKRTLEEIYLKAADVVEDGNVDFFDIVRINRFRLHKITEL